MTSSDVQVSTVTSAIDKYRGGDAGEVGAALAVVGLSAERVAREVAIRGDMIRVAHSAGASLRQLAEVSGLDRKTVTAIVAVAQRPSRARARGVPGAAHVGLLEVPPDPRLLMVTDSR